MADKGAFVPTDQAVGTHKVPAQNVILVDTAKVLLRSLQLPFTWGT
jgi:hypothetical protein